MEPGRQQQLARLLRSPVPPHWEGGKREWEAWKAEWSEFDQSIAPLLLETLRTGTENEQYVALLGLRFVGYSASADGYGSQTVYVIDGPDGSQVIRPLRPPKDLDLPVVAPRKPKGG